MTMIKKKKKAVVPIHSLRNKHFCLLIERAGKNSRFPFNLTLTLAPRLFDRVSGSLVIHLKFETGREEQDRNKTTARAFKGAKQS